METPAGVGTGRVQDARACAGTAGVPGRYQAGTALEDSLVWREAGIRARNLARVPSVEEALGKPQWEPGREQSRSFTWSGRPPSRAL